MTWLVKILWVQIKHTRQTQAPYLLLKIDVPGQDPVFASCFKSYGYLWKQLEEAARERALVVLEVVRGIKLKEDGSAYLDVVGIRYAGSRV